MTLLELENAEQRMQRQWYDLVMAEQEGEPLEVLEQLYDSYILLVEEYNRCSDEFQQDRQARRGSAAKTKKITRPISSRYDDNHVKLAS
ncbi:MAG TPA: hypothetical protein VF043_05425 [Ktedonobacteraceae bacterium]